MRTPSRPDLTRGAARLACVVALPLALSPLVGAPARAELVEFPPLTLSHFTHVYDGGAYDQIVMPGAGYDGPGGTVTFGTGDVVRVVMQTPPGKKFVVHAVPVETPASGPAQLPPAPPIFFVHVHWIGTAGEVTHWNPYTVWFRDFAGTRPTLGYNLIAASEVVVETWLDYQIHGDFEFTALVVDIQIDQPLARAPRAFESVQSYSSPAIGFWAPTTNPAGRAIEIVDIFPTASAATTWGRLKALYR